MIKTLQRQREESHFNNVFCCWRCCCGLKLPNFNFTRHLERNKWPCFNFCPFFSSEFKQIFVPSATNSYNHIQILNLNKIKNKVKRHLQPTCSKTYPGFLHTPFNPAVPVSASKAKSNDFLRQKETYEQRGNSRPRRVRKVKVPLDSLPAGGRIV